MEPLDEEVYDLLVTLTEEAGQTFTPTFTLDAIAARLFAKRHLQHERDTFFTRLRLAFSPSFSVEKVHDALERLKNDRRIESCMRQDKWRYRLPVPRLMSK